MLAPPARHCAGVLFTVAFALAACGDDTSPSGGSGASGGGGRGDGASGGGGGGVGGAEGGGGASGGAPPDLGACEPGPTPGPLSADGGLTTPTGTYSDWIWPAPMTSLEWHLAIELEPADDGYYWAHQFGFAGPDAGGGYMGLQMNGAFRADPPSGPVETTKMAVFAIAGASLDAELGDVAYPDARVDADFDGDAGWNIHAKYEWVACRAYRLRLGPNGTGPNGDLWIGAWIGDTETHEETYLGRILVPAGWGQFSTFSVMWSERFGYGALAACSDQQHSSVIFTTPTGNDGAITASSGGDHFYNPSTCPTSRFTTLPVGVRQEMGVPSP